MNESVGYLVGIVRARGTARACKEVIWTIRVKVCCKLSAGPTGSCYLSFDGSVGLGGVNW